MLLLAVVSLAADATADPAPSLLSYGGVGLLALALLWAVRELWAREKTNSDHHRERADKAEAEVRRLNTSIQDQHLPALVKATEIMGQLLTKAPRRP